MSWKLSGRAKLNKNNVIATWVLQQWGQTRESAHISTLHTPGCAYGIKEHGKVSEKMLLYKLKETQSGVSCQNIDKMFKKKHYVKED